AGIADAAAAVDGVADRDRVDEAAVVAAVVLVAVVEGAPQVGVADLVAGDVDVDADGLRGRMAAGDVHHDLADGLAGHLLGGVHGGEDGVLGRLHVDDGAALEAVGDLVADADHLRMALVADARDEAAHLGGADIETGDDATARHMSRLSHPVPPVDQLDSVGVMARSVLHPLPVAHVSSPLACARASAAGARWTCSWLGRRRSMTVRSRPKMPYARSSR